MVVNRVSLDNGSFDYFFKSKKVRHSKRIYNYALSFKALEVMGAAADDKYFRIVGFGNNPLTLLNNWKRIYHYGILKVLDVK